jgi:hypothetical protein
MVLILLAAGLGSVVVGLAGVVVKLAIEALLHQ